MLEKLKDLAAKFSALRIPALILALPLMFLLAWILMTSNSRQQDIYLIPALLLFIWLLLLFSFLSLFAQVPAPAAVHQSWFNRMKAGLMRAFYYLVALFMLAVTAALLLTSMQLAGAWLRMY